ncbi:unnamed protein product [Chondrus crispus]|uniref:Uncharacterized protein n=1 Tax=Chondrus crispus TaxID=2769 RepID=R7QEB3_CHOCR|nr:unnamed protein product [Chondrus crispus]CDF35796.1 unnamed protein product [Chondrus crispus]|eukprot:XP_005715615.1 unnamed protein product [Chondrus crispus]
MKNIHSLTNGQYSASRALAEVSQALHGDYPLHNILTKNIGLQKNVTPRKTSRKFLAIWNKACLLTVGRLRASQSPLQRSHGQKEPSSGGHHSTEGVVQLGSSNKENADPHAACEFPGMRFVSDNISEDDVPIAQWPRGEKYGVLLQKSAVSKTGKEEAASALLELRHYR